MQRPSWQHHCTADGPLASISMLLPITEGSRDKNHCFLACSASLFTQPRTAHAGEKKKNTSIPHSHRKRYLGQVVIIALQMVSCPEKDVQGLGTITTQERMRTLAKTERNNKPYLGDGLCYPFAECTFTLTGPECSTQDSPRHALDR